MTSRRKSWIALRIACWGNTLLRLPSHTVSDGSHDNQVAGRPIRRIKVNTLTSSRIDSHRAIRITMARCLLTTYPCLFPNNLWANTWRYLQVCLEGPSTVSTLARTGTQALLTVLDNYFLWWRCFFAYLSLYECFGHTGHHREQRGAPGLFRPRECAGCPLRIVFS